MLEWIVSSIIYTWAASYSFVSPPTYKIASLVLLILSLSHENIKTNLPTTA